MTDILKSQLEHLLETNPKLGENVYQSIKEVCLKYVIKFFSSRCALDLIKFGFFDVKNQIKEITESMSAYYHLTDVMKKFFHTTAFLSWEDVEFFDVGSGSSPNTAALFAFKSGWSCHAIDPVLNIERWENNLKVHNVKRISLHKCQIQKFDVPKAKTNPGSLPRIAVIALVHAHVDPITAISALPAFDLYFVYALECCQKLDIKSLEPLKDGRDLAVLSPKNKYRVYAFDKYKWQEIVNI